MASTFEPSRDSTPRRSLHRVTRLGLGCLLAGGLAAASGAEEAVRRVSVMGTWMEVRAEADRPGQAGAAAERAVRAVEAAEARLSTWRDDTELARLNRAPVGQWQRLSPALARDLAESRRWWRATDGAFSPALGPLVEAWGLRSGGRVPTAHQLEAARAASRADRLELDGRRARRLSGSLVLEEGGFGKGAALADALAALTRSDACVWLDLGGQLAAGGRCPTRVVGLAHPERREVTVAAIEIGTGSVATSGNTVRRVEAGGRRFGHLLDPRSGRPAEIGGSATVLSADPIAADCLATALAVMDADAPAWLARHPGVEAVLARLEGGRLRLLATREAAGRIVGIAPGVVIERVASRSGGSFQGRAR